MPNYTPDQKRAIDARGTHLLLAAAAGSGKTFTLVERILALLSEGADVDSMLIITFTRAAAADMKAKLMAKMAERAEGDETLQGQLRRVETANIQTIDSFCAEVVRGHFEAADADPLFRVPDDAEHRQIMAKALEQALEAAYEADSEDLKALHFGRGVKGVGQLTTAVYRFAQNRPDPDEWLRRALLALPLSDGRIWLDELALWAQRSLWTQYKRAEYALSLCQRDAGPLAYRDAILSDMSLIEAALGEEGYEDVAPAVMRIAWAKLGAVKKADAVDEALQERVKKLRDEWKKEVKALQQALGGLDEQLLDMRSNQPAMRALYGLVSAFSEALSAAMADRGLMSFGDVAHAALRALREPGVRDNLRRRFSHIFVDEYQDVTDMQQALIDCVSRGDNVFMVGDVKQSIYRFRQAEPGLFIDVHRRFSRGDGGQLIPLSKNFRSRPSVLGFVNAVFERAMSGPGSEIEYDADARLYPGQSFEGEDPPVELHIAVKEAAFSDDDEPDELAELQDAEREGLLIARRIQEIKAEWPEYRFRDFAVMLRSRTGMAALERTLADAGVPVYADMNKGYLGAVEVQVARALLQVIENRRRDAELLAVLHSPIGKLNSVELATLRARHRAGSYRDAMLDYLDAFDDDIATKLGNLEDKLDGWRALSRALPLPELVDVALTESGYYMHVGRGPGGAQRQANLDLLRTYAAEYEAAEGGGLTGFLRYVGQIERTGDDMSAAHALGEGDDVVQLMTIHKSKGLEYPVVIGAMLGKALKRGDKIGEVSLHRDLGCGLALNDMELGSRRRTLAQRAIAEKSAIEQLNEEMRVLYVLLTRAVDRLVLVGTVKSISAAETAWRIEGAEPKCYLDALAPLVLGAEGGEALLSRGAADVDVGGARVCARIVRAGLPQVRDVQDEDQGDVVPSDDDMRRALFQLSWRYPHEGDVLRPLKLTVSGLTRDVAGPLARPAVNRRPKFLSGDGLTNTERGTLTHQALMGLLLAPLRGLHGAPLLEALQGQLDALLAQGRLMAPLEPGVLQRFLEGPVGQRMLAAEEVRREWPFVLRMPIREALGEDSQGSALVQGVIDCCFVEDGQWVLLDYKTDRAEDVEALLARYRPQLTLYAAALARITGRPVKQRLLCLLRSGVAVEG